MGTPFKTRGWIEIASPAIGGLAMTELAAWANAFYKRLTKKFVFVQRCTGLIGVNVGRQ